MKKRTTIYDTWTLLALFATVTVSVCFAGTGIRSAFGREDLAGLGNRITTFFESFSCKSYDVVDSLINCILSATDAIYNILYIDLCNIFLGL
ncbi:MAG: hypothetical protein K2M11_10460 [Paramuribaculum sp.]|nr:hypothetical protein [Paramuribaculum sp.]